MIWMATAPCSLTSRTWVMVRALLGALVLGSAEVLLPLDLHGGVKEHWKKIGQSSQAMR